ncbi:MAG: energy transducer TonB [Saprospirales bacterium]|nr:MAG: energy transducer TonB [Saprospirales bacterium]
MREAKDKHFLKKPIYEGGRQALFDFIKRNLKYPKEALKNKIEGVVIVRYTINKDGKVIKTEVKNSLGYGCDEEAQRVVKMLKFHVPKNRKLKVLFHKKIHIKFTLPKKKDAPKKVEISYSSQKKDEQKPKTSYEYTIEY